MFINGNILFQAASKYRGGKFVWWKDAGRDSRSMVLNGNKIMNPYKQGGWAFAADLFEYNLNGEGYILKVFKVVKDVAASDTEILISGDGYSHNPEVGNILMKAPKLVTDTGTAGIVIKIGMREDPSLGDVFVLSIVAGSLGTLTKGDLLVEAESEGEDKTVLVKNPNTFIEVDTYFDIPTNGSRGITNAQIFINTIFGKRAFENRMSPLPEYVKAKNRSYINGVFEL